MSKPYVAAVNYGVTPPERLETMHLLDGRTLAWAEWGPPDGLPVVFCTGAAMSRWLRFGADNLIDLGVRLLALTRATLMCYYARLTHILENGVLQNSEIWPNDGALCDISL